MTDQIEWLEWIEPFSDNGPEPVVCRIKPADLITVYKRRPEYKGASAETIIEDFKVVHWATEIMKEKPTNGTSINANTVSRDSGSK